MKPPVSHRLLHESCRIESPADAPWLLQDNLSAAPASLAPSRCPTAGSGGYGLSPLTAAGAQALLLADQHCTAVQTRLTQRAGSSSATRAMAAKTIPASQAACSGADGT